MEKNRKKPKPSKSETSELRALLIEDDSDDALMFEETLAGVDKSLKVKMEWVDGLEDGLERLAANSYDIVFLDLSLPGTQGIDTFLTLRDQFPSTPIVILTGFTHDSFADEARTQGAHEYLVKGDIDGALLTRVIRSAVE
ncbi:MAG TPA: response regulator [Candidatus Eisenbacteria bacterium]|jgi:CheY-like chemotaxis protein|nr:response regulator [Candidatus Eisenbacteria bacterium]